MFLLTLYKDGTGNGCAKLAGAHLISQTCCSLFTEVPLAKLKALPSECLCSPQILLSARIIVIQFILSQTPQVKICHTGSDVAIQEAAVSSTLLGDRKQCLDKAQNCLWYILSHCLAEDGHRLCYNQR